MYFYFEKSYKARGWSEVPDKADFLHEFQDILFRTDVASGRVDCCDPETLQPLNEKWSLL